MKNTVRYNLCIVIAIIIIDSMPVQSSAQPNIAGNIIDATNIDAFAEKIRIIIFKRNSNDTTYMVNLPVTQPELVYYNIDPGKPSLVYIHGFQEGLSSENTRKIVEAHSKLGEGNVWLFDWSKLSYHDYETVVKNSKIIAQIFANALTKLVDVGFNIDDCHLVAHSLGAQIAGLIWKYMNHTLPRITGLDPANPGFSQPEDDHIDHRSARFVEIIHADKGFYGFPRNIGTVDFYPNDGKRPQPGCPSGGPILSEIDFCSHHRAWRYYVESVTNVEAFQATQCDNFDNYLDGKCSGNRVINMGYGTPLDAYGTYYLTTHDQFPFGQFNLISSK